MMVVLERSRERARSKSMMELAGCGDEERRIAQLISSSCIDSLGKPNRILTAAVVSVRHHATRQILDIVVSTFRVVPNPKVEGDTNLPVIVLEEGRVAGSVEDDKVCAKP